MRDRDGKDYERKRLVDGFSLCSLQHLRSYSFLFSFFNFLSLHMELKKKKEKWTYLQNRNKVTDVENTHGYQWGNEVG